METTGSDLDFGCKYVLFKALQENTHVVAKYFDLRTQSYFKNVMGPVFGVDSFWYRQEFAKSKVWCTGIAFLREQIENLIIFCITLSQLAYLTNYPQKNCQSGLKKTGLTASHPAGKDKNGTPKTDYWRPSEGSAPPPPEEKRNPC
jgi:hypothetical protein